jgi:TolB-like protein
MKRAVTSVLVIWLSGGVLGTAQQLDTVAATLVSKLAAGRKTVAVVDFTDLQGSATELGRYLAEELSVALAIGAKGFTVVDRTHLKAILQEHKLAASGIIDPLTARQLGKLAGVDTLITGTLTPFGDSVRLSVKALDTQTAGMLAATAADVPRTRAIEELLTRSVSPSLGSSTGSGGGGRSGPSPAQRVQGAGVTLELQSCSKSGTCRLIASADDDSTIVVNTFLLRAWDDSGNEYRSDSVRVGNQNEQGRLIAGVRTPITINFRFFESESQGVREGLRQRSGAQSGGPPSRLSAIEFPFSTGSSDATLRFRNIALQ